MVTKSTSTSGEDCGEDFCCIYVAEIIGMQFEFPEVAQVCGLLAFLGEPCIPEWRVQARS